MAGLESYGASLPALRLPASAYKAAWGACQARGLKQKAFCAYDEDAVTLGIEAARAALARFGGDAPHVAALFVGMTSPPYEEKPSSATIATALFAHDALRVVEIGGSPQAGLQALAAAGEFCDAHPGAYALAVAADAPSAPPDAPFEHALGAAGAAFLVGPGGAAGEIIGASAVTRESFGARFRRHGAADLSDLELRTRDNQASLAALGQALGAVDAAHIAMGADSTLARGAPKIFGCADAAIDGVWADIGDAGAASAPLALADTLDRARPGETVLAAAIGAGGMALTIVAGDGLAQLRAGGDSVAALMTKGETVDYVDYLKHRRVLSSRFGGAG